MRRVKIREKIGPSQGIQKMRPSGAKCMDSQIRGKNARRNPKTGAVRPQKRGCL